MKNGLIQIYHAWNKSLWILACESKGILKNEFLHGKLFALKHYKRTAARKKNRYNKYILNSLPGSPRELKYQRVLDYV